MSWSPLLSGVAAEQALESVREIAEALRDPGLHIAELSYAGGLAGVALFFCHAAIGLEDKRLTDTAWMFLDRAVQAAGEESFPLGFFDGLAGLAWTMQHLQALLNPNPEADLTEEADEILSQVVRVSPWPRHFDLVYGLTGIGVYALDHPDERMARDLIGQVVERLWELAVHHDSGISWRTPTELLLAPVLREKYPSGCEDLGVAHGASGVLGFLARAVRTGLAPASALELLDSGVRWLLTQQRPDDGGSAFGAYSDPAPQSCRSAWCYGDPGVALQLLAASRTLDRADLERLAIQILVRDSQRPEEDTLASGPSLCHGAAGLGHLYNFFYQTCGERTVARAARRWFERTLAMRKPGEGIAGYANWWPQEREWHAEPGFLTGAAGVGLALLAAASPGEPSWGRPMLL